MVRCVQAEVKKYLQNGEALFRFSEPNIQGATTSFQDSRTEFVDFVNQMNIFNIVGI
jgi:hypothetical protein